MISEAHIFLANQCVNDCIFCAVADKRRHDFPSSKFEIVSFIKDTAGKGTNRLVLSGWGEPTLDPCLEEYLDVAHSEGFKDIVLFTNGYNITKERVANWKKLGLTSVLLSMHGMEQSHDQSVGREGSFREALSALQLFLEFNLRVTLNTCLTLLNINDINSLVHFVRDFPIIEHSLSYPEWSGNALRHKKFMPCYREIADRAGELIPDKDGKTFFVNVPLCLGALKFHQRSPRAPITLLQQEGALSFRPHKDKIYPQQCVAVGCRVIDQCPGFEKNYVADRGWGQVLDRVKRFLNPDGKPRGPARSKRGYGCLEPETAAAKSFVAIVKPTMRCNSACAYCNTRHSNSKKDLDLGLFRNFCDELFKYAHRKKISQLTFLWHGGEPLLMGKQFYEKALELPSTIFGTDIRINHTMQSNFLILDSDWLTLLKEYNVAISTSVEPVGTARVWKNGSQQYATWFDKFVQACDAGLKVGIVLTVTSEHLGRAKEIYHFFKNLQPLTQKGVAIRVNPVHATSATGPADEVSYLISPTDYGIFLYQLSELWERDERRLTISPISGWSRGVSDGCESSGACQDHFLGLDGSGGIYLCGRFAGFNARLGSILTESLQTIGNHPQLATIGQRASKLRATHCQDCRLWDFCRGGCPAHALLYSGKLTDPSPFCQSFRVFFERTGWRVAARSQQGEEN